MRANNYRAASSAGRTGRLTRESPTIYGKCIFDLNKDRSKKRAAKNLEFVVEAAAIADKAAAEAVSTADEAVARAASTADEAFSTKIMVPVSHSIGRHSPGAPR